MTSFGEALSFYADRQHDEDKRTAINLQYTEVKKNKRSNATINIEMAFMPAGDDKPQWADKIFVQLSPEELTGFCELLFGLRREFECKFHGPSRNKGVTVYNNDERGVLIQLSEAGRVMKHMLTHSQRIELGVFVIRRQAMSWQISVSDVLAVLRQSVAICKPKK